MPSKKRTYRRKANTNPAAANAERMQPGKVEWDHAAQVLVIHPAANPQQVNPVVSKAHGRAAAKEAKVLISRKASPQKKSKAVAEARKVERREKAKAAKKLARKNQRRNRRR